MAPRKPVAEKGASRQQRRAAARAGQSIPTVRRRIGFVIPAIGVGAILLGLAAWVWWPRATPEPLSSPLPGPAQDSTPSWLPNGHEIAFSRRQDGHADLFVMNDDGTNVRQMTTTPSTDESAPAYSPDGAHLVFESVRPGAAVDLLTMDADGSNTRVLATGLTHNFGAAWSADSKQIAFTWNRDGGQFGIYRMDAGGSVLMAIERLTEAASDGFPQYSPDGKKLAFHVGRGIAVIDLATKMATRLTADVTNSGYPAWSPDGARLACVSWQSGRAEIFTMKADGSDQHVLVSMPGHNAVEPRWSPDGTRIVFTQTPAAAQGLLPATAESTVDVVAVATGEVRRLSK